MSARAHRPEHPSMDVDRDLRARLCSYRGGRRVRAAFVIGMLLVARTLVRGLLWLLDRDVYRQVVRRSALAMGRVPIAH